MKIKNIMIAGLMLAATGAFADTTVQTNNKCTDYSKCH